MERADNIRRVAPLHLRSRTDWHRSLSANGMIRGAICKTVARRMLINESRRESGAYLEITERERSKGFSISFILQRICRLLGFPKRSTASCVWDRRNKYRICWKAWNIIIDASRYPRNFATISQTRYNLIVPPALGVSPINIRARGPKPRHGSTAYKAGKTNRSHGGLSVNFHRRYAQGVVTLQILTNTANRVSSQLISRPLQLDDSLHAAGLQMNKTAREPIARRGKKSGHVPFEARRTRGNSLAVQLTHF